MAHRFYAPGASLGDSAVALPADEADHLRRVLRLRAGDEIAVFDGDGREFTARVASISRAAVTVAIVDAVTPARELPVAITLAQSALKGDKMDDVIRDAIMLGAAAVQPFTSARSDVPLAALARRSDRWRRIAIASTKQCGRARLAHVHTPLTLDRWLPQASGSLRIMLVEPSVRGAAPIRDIVASRPESAAVIVGPEGGWAAEEIAAALEAGCTLATLGARTLRADAVALIALSTLQFAWE